MRFNFADGVAWRFAFLAGLEFMETESLPTIVRYRKGDLALNVYHGRQSYEIGFQVGHADELYSMSEILRATDPRAADQYRNYIATTPDEMEAGLDQLTELVRRFAERALRDDHEFFAALRRQRKAWAEANALDVSAQQVRPKAEAAFREGKYREAVELYVQIEPRLTSAEQKKLGIARRRS